jgi:hypothetical protein
VRDQAPRQRFRASPIPRGKTLTCGYVGALDRTRTCSLLIRRQCRAYLQPGHLLPIYSAVASFLSGPGSFHMVESGDSNHRPPACKIGPELSATVAHLGLRPREHRLGSGRVGSCCGQVGSQRRPDGQLDMVLSTVRWLETGCYRQLLLDWRGCHVAHT